MNDKANVGEPQGQNGELSGQGWRERFWYSQEVNQKDRALGLTQPEDLSSRQDDEPDWAPGALPDGQQSRHQDEHLPT